MGLKGVPVALLFGESEGTWEAKGKGRLCRGRGVDRLGLLVLCSMSQLQ